MRRAEAGRNGYGVVNGPMIRCRSIVSAMPMVVDAALRTGWRSGPSWRRALRQLRRDQGLTQLELEAALRPRPDDHLHGSSAVVM